jgi:SLA1 homology domain 1, SHD1
MSAARAMMLSRSAMVRPYGGINYGMNPGYMGSGFGNSGADSSSSSRRMASHARSAVPSRASSAAAVKPAKAVDPAGEASNLDLPTRDWVVNGETGDTVIAAQYAGVIDANVTLRKTDGHITLAPVDRLSPSDREYIAEQVARKTASSVAKN